MKKHPIIASAVVGALAIAVAGVAGASAGPSKSSARTIRATEVFAHGHLVDRGPKGFSAGDTTTFSGTLHAGGKRIGSYQGSCTSASNQIQLCLLEFGLPGGRIAAQARYTSSGDGAITPIVGGTGQFRRARGQIVEHQLAHGRGSLRFHIAG